MNSIIYQVHDHVRDRWTKERDLPPMRLLVNKTTANENLRPQFFRDTSDTFMLRWGRVDLIETPDIADNFALLQFGDEPFIEVQGEPT